MLKMATLLLKLLNRFYSLLKSKLDRYTFMVKNFDLKLAIII